MRTERVCIQLEEATPKEIVMAVLEARHRCFENHHYGPFSLLCGYTDFSLLAQRYSTVNDQLPLTVLERITRIEGIKEVLLTGLLTESKLELMYKDS